MNYDNIFDAKPRCLWEDEYIVGRLKSLAKPNQRVLDLASGTGRFPSRVFGNKNTAVDKDPAELPHASAVRPGDHATAQQRRARHVEEDKVRF